MSCAPCIYSLEPEAAFLPTASLDTRPSLPSSGTSIAAKSYESAPKTDGSQACTCGKGMSDCLIHPSTPEKWIASQRAFLAKTSAALGIKPGSEKARAADFTAKCSELLTSFDPATCSWRTLQQSLITNSSEPFLATWPRAGLMRGGRVYLHPRPVPRTTGIGGGALQNVPTPTVNGNYNRKGTGAKSGDGLATWARVWPTPCASAHKGSGPAALTRKDGRTRANDRIDHAVMASDGGMLNPDWVEWLMGWPIGHTVLKPSATAKSRNKRRLRG